MRARGIFLGLAAVWFALGARAASTPNVLLIVSDDQRTDTIAALGNPVIRTPSLDRLVREGGAFTRAICTIPLCMPSRAELITGGEGLRDAAAVMRGAINPSLTPLAAVLRDAGYATCYVGKWHNDGRPGTRGYGETRALFSGGGGKWWSGRQDHHGRAVTGYKGWVFQSDDGKLFPEQGVGLTPEISVTFADAAIAWIREPRGRPFFLHLNFTAPHDPLLMPPGFEGMYDPRDMPVPANFLPRHHFDHGNIDGRDERLLPMPRTEQDVRADLAVYYAVISQLDREVGRVLDALREAGRERDTLVVYTSDNGLAIGSHGLRGKQNMYDHSIGVPLIIRGPGVPAGRRFDAQVHLRDLYPTICGFSGVAVPPGVEARSLKPVIEGKTQTVRDCVFGWFGGCQRMIRTDRWKLIEYPDIGRAQLFDLRRDPAELNDLADVPSALDVRHDLHGRLDRWRREAGDPALDAREISGSR